MKRISIIFLVITFAGTTSGVTQTTENKKPTLAPVQQSPAIVKPAELPVVRPAVATQDTAAAVGAAPVQPVAAQPSANPNQLAAPVQPVVANPSTAPNQLAAPVQPAAFVQDTAKEVYGPVAQVATLPDNNRSMILNYRIADWASIHSKNDQDAQQTMETLQNIGCEATKHQHNGHFDIRFRCPTWKSMRVDTTQQLDQWQKYLDLVGMESVALNPPRNTLRPTVRFRLPKARTAHLGDKDHADSLVEIFQMLGCKALANDHNGHVDLQLECDQWTTIGLSTEESAHVWQDWLKQNGFETQHTHQH